MVSLPIPDFRLLDGASHVLVYLGCNWGDRVLRRAAEDFCRLALTRRSAPSSQRYERQSSSGWKRISFQTIRGTCPSGLGVADVVFSYSVIQHLLRRNVAEVHSPTIAFSAKRAIVRQNAKRYGSALLPPVARRGFHEGTRFILRYWTEAQPRGARQD